MNIFIYLLLLLCFSNSALSQNSIDYCGTKPSTPLKSDGVVWGGLAAYEGVPVYFSCKSSQIKTHLKFKSLIYVAKEKNNRILLVKLDSKDKIINYVGWGNKKDFVLSEMAHYTKNKYIHRKAMIINRIDDMKGVKESLTEALVYNGFTNTKKKTTDVGVFQIYYIYTPPGLNCDYELLGRTSFIHDLKTPDEIIGWVHNKRMIYWNHRLALEINKEKKAIQERIKNNQPVIVFKDQTKLNEYYLNNNLDSKSIAAKETLEDGPRWPQSAPRWPILNNDGNYIFKRGLKNYRIGAIGDLELYGNDTHIDKIKKDEKINNQKEIYSKKDFYENQEKVEVLIKMYSNVDILFLIDATNSIKPYFKAITEGIEKAINEIKDTFNQIKDRSKLRFAIGIYRDPKDDIPFEWMTKDRNGNMFQISVDFVINKMKNIIKDSKKKSYTENMLGGLMQALEEAKFKEPHSYRITFIIGDAGSAENLENYTGYKNLSLIQEGINDIPRNIYASTERSKNKSVDFEKKNINIFSKIGNIIKKKKVRIFPLLIKDINRENNNFQFRQASLLFEKQSKLLKKESDTWVNELIKVESNYSSVSNVILNEILMREKETRLSKCVLDMILQKYSASYIINNTHICKDNALVSIDDSKIPFRNLNSYGVIMMVGDVLSDYVSSDFIQKNKIQGFRSGYVLKKHPYLLNEDFVKPVILLSEHDFYILVGVLSGVTHCPKTTKNLGDVWKNSFKATIGIKLGADDDELKDSFAENMDLIGIPVKSDLLSRPFSDFNAVSNKITTKEIDDIYDILTEKWEKLSNYNQRSENFFTVHKNYRYTWLDIELLP